MVESSPSRESPGLESKEFKLRQLYDKSLRQTDQVHDTNDQTLLALLEAAHQGNVAEVGSLLQSGADIQGSDRLGRTALHVAAEAGHAAAILLLIELGANIHTKDKWGMNALQKAVEKGHGSVVKQLLKHEADANSDKLYRTAFDIALRKKDAPLWKLLIEGGDGGLESLHKAMDSGNGATVKLLPESGADANAQGGRYGNALCAAACRGDQALVKVLLAAGADVNAQGGQYGNALCSAAYSGNQVLVKALLAAGADVNAQGGRYGNALCAAACKGDQALVKTLLAAGADVNAHGHYGNALATANKSRYKEIANLLRKAGAT